MYAEVRSQVFGGTPLTQTPPVSFPKVVFGIGKVNQNSYCAPNLKSLASAVAEISRGSQISDVLYLRFPPVLVLKVVFGKHLRKPKLHTKREGVRFNDCRNT